MKWSPRLSLSELDGESMVEKKNQREEGKETESVLSPGRHFDDIRGYGD